MIVSVMQHDLVSAINTASKFVDRNPPLPALGNILIEAHGHGRLSVSATNLEWSVRTYIPAKVEQEGAITVPTRVFRELVSRFSKESVYLRVSHKDHSLEIRCGVQSANIRCVPVKEYPPIKHYETYDVVFDGDKFKQAIKHPVYSAADELNRPILTGVNLSVDEGIMKFAGADGYRLAVSTLPILNGEVPFPEGHEFTIPAKALNITSQILNGDDEIGIAFPKIEVDDKGEHKVVSEEYLSNSISFMQGDTVVTSQLLSGRFPDFDAVFPGSFDTVVTMYRNDMLALCRRAKIFSRDNAWSTEMVVSSSGKGGMADVIVTGRSPERGDTEGRIHANLEGAPIEISFNVGFIVDVLSALDTERVVFSGNGPEHPMLIEGEGQDGFKYLVMPMKK